MIKSNVKVLMKQKELNDGIRLSYDLIAAETGISRSAIAKLANNRTTMISFDTLNGLCNFFQVTPDKILLWTPDNKD